MSRDSLTARQGQVFEFILSCVRDEGYTPTVREIAGHLGIRHANAVSDHLRALERKGYIRRRAHCSRNIEIAPAHMPAPGVGIPIVGRVAAGRPITAMENLDGYLRLDELYDRDLHYALRVHGDSMIDAGIWDGDYAIVRQQAYVENGEIGVAIVDGEATVKRIRQQKGAVVLVPANENYQPLRVDLRATDFRIGGKVVGMHRVLG